MNELPDIVHSILSSPEGILAIAGTIIAAVVSIVVDFYKKNRAEKQILDKWINCLRQSAGVNKCLEEYEDLIDWKDLNALSLRKIAVFIVRWFTSSIVLVVLILFNSVWLAAFLMLSINFAIYYSTRMSPILTTNTNFTEIYKKHVNHAHNMNETLYTVNFFGFYYALQHEYQLLMLLVWVLGITFWVVSHYRLKKSTENILSELRKKLDRDYQASFPIIETDNPMINGKLETVFDERFLVMRTLDSQDGTKICYPFESINYLKIKD